MFIFWPTVVLIEHRNIKDLSLYMAPNKGTTVSRANFICVVLAREGKSIYELRNKSSMDIKPQRHA